MELQNLKFVTQHHRQQKEKVWILKQSFLWKVESNKKVIEEEILFVSCHKNYHLRVNYQKKKMNDIVLQYKYKMIQQGHVTIEYVKQNQKLVEKQEQSERSPFSRVSKLATFVYRSPNQQLKRRELKIRLEIFSLPLQTRLIDAIKVHLNNVGSYIQNYRDLQYRKSENDSSKLIIQAQPYRFTLAELIRYCKSEQLKLPQKSDEFIIHCMLQIYKYILYLLDKFHTEKYFGLSYDISPEYLAFNEEYRLVLIYPCLSKKKPIILRKNREQINMEFRKLFKQTLIQLSSVCNDFCDHGIMKYFEDDNRNSIEISEEKNVLRAFSGSIKVHEIPHFLFKFIKKFEKKNASPLTQHFKKIQEKQKQMLFQYLNQLP